MILNINGTNTTIAVDDSSYRYRAIMGENSLTLTFALPGFLDIPVGSYCDFQGERYTLTKPQNFKKNNLRNFEYTLILDSNQSQLKKYKFRDTNDGTRLKFSLTARPQEHLAMLVANLNLRDTGWAVGAYVDAVEKTIAYNHAFCIDALKQMAEAFETEWEVNGKTINLRKVEYNKTAPLALSYGRGNGFKPGVGRTNMDNARPVEILYVQGGNRNIDPSKYGAKELLLPKCQTYTYEGRTYQTDAAGLSVRRADKALVTMEEDSLDLTNVYPSRVGTISSVTTVDAAANFYDFIDTSIPLTLDYKACLIAGETMTVIFQSGMLAGRELEVSYDHATRKFAIVPQELDGVTMPGSAFIPAAGDKYAVFGIQLPDAYICDNTTQTGGSWDMLKQAVKYLYENEDPRFSFTGELDGIWAKANWLAAGGKLILGGYISFTDTQFQTAPTLIRIVGIKDFINNPYKPQIELSNITIGPTVASSLAKIETNEVVTAELHRDAIQYTKRRFRDAKETIDLLNDALLNFSDGINPATVQTMQALVGDESLQFRFVNSKTTPTEIDHVVTFDPSAKTLTSAAGILQHMTLGIATISSSHAPAEYKFWDVAGYTSPALEDKPAFYLYAKVSTTGTTGTFVLSATAIKKDAVAGFYHLLVGILNSEYEGTRSFVTLYGFTEILPGRITTNKIVSADGYNFLDFVNNAFKVGNATTFLDWNTKGDGKLRLKGTLLQSPSGTESLPGVFRGAYNAVYTYYQGDEVTYLGSTYRYINATQSTGILPTNTSYWIVVAAAGATGTPGIDGTDYEYIFIRTATNVTPATPATSQTNDYIPTGGWTDDPIGVSSSIPYEWVANRSKTAGIWSAFSTPALWAKWGYDGSQGIQGSPGVNGSSLYTWLKYADTPTTGMSDSPTGKTYMGIAYNKTSSTESTNYADYDWSLIQGTQGIQGVAGSSLYTWVKYATDANGTGLNDSPTGMTHIGLAYNKTSPTESTTASDYSWSLIQGPTGPQGIPGSAGADGASLYTWLKYADGAPLGLSNTPAGKSYIGIAYNQASSFKENVDYTKYAWGTLGDTTGMAGVSGTGLYTWIKYATDSSGTGISDSPAGCTYIGLAFGKSTAVKSTTATDYAWTLMSSSAVTGSQGLVGSTLYTWIKYGLNSAGAGISDSISGATYIGIAYNQTTPVKSTNAADYTWYAISTTGGVSGISGSGLYTWIKYGTSSAGAGLADTTSGKTYVGLAFGKSIATESTTASDYTWSLIGSTTGFLGSQGIAPGAVYTWVKFADSYPTGMSDTPDGKKYMGVAYNKASSTESSTWSDYEWSLIQGKDGIQGPAGSSLYTWVKYATSAAGAGIDDSPTGMTYIGFAFNQASATEGTDPAAYTWSLIQGAAGATGAAGDFFEYRYAKNGSTSVPPTIVTTDAIPSGWTTTVPTIGSLEYLWSTIAKKTSAGALSQNWSTPVR